MKFIVLVLFVNFLLLSCGKVINPKPLELENSSSAQNFNFFALATHLTMGSCENPPVAHRFIRFVPLFLTEASDDIFIGDLTLVLYDESKSYTAYYREWPGVGNTDQTLFELKFEGKYSYETSPTSPDGHFLRLTDIGQLVPSATNDKVTFILTLNKKINRPYASTQVQGRVSLGVSPLFSDCP